MTAESIAIANDHAGVELKQMLVADLQAMGFRVINFGTDTNASVDYPDFAARVVDAIKKGEASKGVLICGTGIGISIAANRSKGIRAAPCHDSVSARLAREHNDANILALGARTIGPEVARECVRVFFSTKFDGGERHTRRVSKMG